MMAALLPLWISLPVGILLGLFFVIILVRVIKNSRRINARNVEMRKEREVTFEFINQIGDLFAHADEIDMDQLLDRILFYAMRSGKASSGAIYLFNKDRTRLFARSVSGVVPPLYDSEKIKLRTTQPSSHDIETQIKGRPVLAGEGLIGLVADVGSGIIIEDGEVDARVPSYEDTFLRIRSMLVVPMRFGQEVLGVLLLVNRTDEQPFTPSDLSLLQSMADQASVPIHYADLRDALEQKKQIDRDMRVAQQIQSSLLPQALPQREGIRLAAYNLPAFDIGGDYYDFIDIDEDHIGIAIADVSGKGIGGAMMMAVCQGVLRTRATKELSPSLMLSELNRVLSDNLAEDMFITMLYLVYNTRTRELRFARAGHESPILRRAATGEHELLSGSGVAIGLTDPDTFDCIINDQSVQLNQGDIVVLYTDGITEAMNPQNEEWGLEALQASIDEDHEKDVSQITLNICEKIDQFVGSRQQYDDMTLLSLQVT